MKNTKKLELILIGLALLHVPVIWITKDLKSIVVLTLLAVALGLIAIILQALRHSQE